MMGSILNAKCSLKCVFKDGAHVLFLKISGVRNKESGLFHAALYQFGEV